MVIRNRPNYRALWSPHGEDGWYIVTVMENYRFHKAYIPKTRAERISDTVYFSPKQFNVPHMSSTDATFHTSQDLICAIHNPSPSSPLVKLVNGNKEALRNLAEIFRKANP